MKRIENNPPDLISTKALQVFLFLSVFFVGTYYEYLSAIASVFLIVWLWWAKKKQGKTALPKSPTVFSMLLIAASFAASALWAVDRGMAIFGFIKFLPLPLFALALAQTEPAQRSEMLDVVPLSGAVMVVISGVLSFFEPLKQYFLVNSRLAGFFQYPNVFAVYLLLGIVTLAKKERWRAMEIAMLLAMLTGIFASGSRTTFILLVITVLWLCFTVKGKTRRVPVIALIAIIAATSVYAVLSGDVSSMGRYITTSLKTSTFLGRLLYYKDALPVIMAHPFGLGYLGYCALEGSFQTGVYTIVNIHNELLQLLLDIGWLPTIVLVFALVRSFKNNNPTGRMLLMILVLHCLLDFDMQFVSIGFVLILVMMQEERSEILKLKQGFLMPAGIILACASLYFGIASAEYYMGNYEAATGIYPAYTNAWKAMLVSAQDVQSLDTIADKILSYNESDSLSYSAKARAAYSKGDFGSMIEYKEKAISLARYELDEYLDYFNMLQVGIQLYIQNNDMESAMYCRDKLLEIPQMLKAVEEETSDIAWKLNDKPELTLPDEYLDVLAQLKTMN